MSASLQDAVTLAQDLQLKAWRIEPEDMLVFATSRNRARRIVVECGPGEHEYVSVLAYRHPSLDRFADRERLMCCNDELPAGCPRFWQETA